MEEVNLISTEQNKQLKNIKALQQKKKREEAGKFIVEGLRFIEEALAKRCLEKVFLSDNVQENKRLTDFLNKCVENEISIYRVEEKIFNKITETVNSQGIIGVGLQPEWSEDNLFKGESLILFVDGVQDPGNLGTILRTSYGAGIGGVILSKGTVDLYNSKVLRATMGAIFSLPIINWDGNPDLFQKLKVKGYQIVAAELNTEINYYNLNLVNPTLLVVGNEAKGPSEEVLQQVDLKAKLPMPGQAESLNVGVATGVLIFEALRQRNFNS